MKALLAIALLAIASGCASTGAPPQKDPWERFNRGTHEFNDGLDRLLLKPAAQSYTEGVPGFAQEGVSNFFANIADVGTGLNNLLQGKVADGASDLARFAVNTVVGIGGLWDVATPMGLEKHDEDFGQTLGWWGVPAGPYLVLPVLGPSGARDATGLAVDYAASVYVPPGREINDVVFFNPAVLALFIVNARYSQPFRYFSTGSAFDYELVRFLFRTQREFEIQR